MKPIVGIVMGSESDRPAMTAAVDMLAKFGVDCELIVSSAHRSPARTSEYAQKAKERGLKVIIAGAGWAAHLAGVIAAETTLPVIGVPLASSPLNGLDSVLATLQMPPGVPVATMAIGPGGAKNAAILAVQMLALSDSDLAQKLVDFKEEMANAVASAPKK